MSTIVGNLERRLAAYAEEQKKSKPKTTQPKRYRGRSKRAGSGGWDIKKKKKNRRSGNKNMR